MRIQLNRSGRDDQGAVAVIVAILLTVLLVLSAFAVDFGMAYSNKRQLQTAADSSAIAAASVYANESGACTPAFLSTHAAAADTAGQAAMNDNYTYAPVDAYTFTPSCDSGFATVNWAIEATSDAGLGGVIGVGDIGINREATAQVRIPSMIASGVRPYMLCSNDVPSGSLPSPIVKVAFPATVPGPTGSCPSAATPGNWWSINCPESNNNGELAKKTLKGCDDPVGIVDGQPAVGPPPNTALRNHLINVGCAGDPDFDCLNADTGQINNNNLWDAWASLVNNEEEVFLPVFCGDTRCNPAAVEIDASGNNVDYPVHRMVAVTICGYDWGTGGSGNRRRISTTGECAGNTFQVKDGTGDTNAAGAPDGINTDYMLLRVHVIQTAGSVTPSNCKPGDPCDGGARQVLMIE